MYFAIFLLVAMIGLVLGLLLYRMLVRSKSFGRLIGGVIEPPPPETPQEVVNRLRAEKERAHSCVGQCRQKAAEAGRSADEIREELRQSHVRRSRR